VSLPSAAEVASLGCLVLFYLVVNSIWGESGYAFARVVGEFAFGAVLIIAAVRSVFLDPLAIWLGIFWLRLASAIYFGLGSLGQFFFNETTNLMSDSFYTVLPGTMFKMDIVCALGAFGFMATSLAAGRLFVWAPPADVPRSSDKLLLACAVVFCGVGYTIKFLVELPLIFGLLTTSILPASTLILAELSIIGVYLLTLWCTRYGTSYLPIAAALAALSVSSGAVTFSKAQTILPFIMFAIAFLSGRTSLRRIAFATVGVLSLFQVMVPAVQYGRAELEQRYGSIDTGSLGERLEILGQYFFDSERAVSLIEVQNSWSRFYYAPSEAAAIDQYDTGQPGNSLADSLIILIPRALWPEKPIFDVGSRFNLSINGNAESSSWMGIYSEAYWNFGWLGIPLVFVPLALAYLFIARSTISILKRARWLHIPVAFLGMFMGMRVDSDIVQSQFAPAVFCFAVYKIADFFDWPGRASLGIVDDTALSSTTRSLVASTDRG
jgi:hypothetical protein